MRPVYIPTKLNHVADSLSRYEPTLLPHTHVMDACTLKSALPHNIVFDWVAASDDFGHIARYTAKHSNVVYYTKHHTISDIANSIASIPHSTVGWIMPHHYMDTIGISRLVQALQRSSTTCTIYALLETHPHHKQLHEYVPSAHLQHVWPTRTICMRYNKSKGTHRSFSKAQKSYIPLTLWKIILTPHTPQ